MLEPLLHKLATQRIVLASGSPRRKEILDKTGIKFEVIPSTFVEDLDKKSFAEPQDYALKTAEGKALEVMKRLSSEETAPDLVIGADTVLYMNGRIFEKPKDKTEACNMLAGFSGGKHIVITGVILLRETPGGMDLRKFYEKTEVTFANLSENVIKAYVETGEPMDKAGGYGIQARGATLIESIVGDYFNVMGFPLHKFAKNLCEMY